MVNRCKLHDERFWNIWKASGAIDTVHPLVEIVGIAKHTNDSPEPLKGRTVLSVDNCVVLAGVLDGRQWRVLEPSVHYVVPHGDYSSGTRCMLPKAAVLLDMHMQQ